MKSAARFAEREKHAAIHASKRTLLVTRRQGVPVIGETKAYAVKGGLQMRRLD